MTKNGLKVSFGGFAELDFVNDNMRNFAYMVGNRPVLTSSRLGGNSGQFAASPRNSRLTMNVKTPEHKGVNRRLFVAIACLGNQP